MRSETSGTQPASPVTGLSDLRVLARGGYSTVYRARQDSIGREVALKIDTRSLDSERDRRRFLREAEAAGRMSGHPNVVNVYDAGVTEDNHPYLVMELCTGGSYATRLREVGPLSTSEVREVGVKIADALQAAHEAGILHRDVKPGNILINRYGVPGLADFGLAALPDPSRELSVTIEALTPAYAPPEVFRMEPPTPLGDQYALAASLYALLSGRPPRWPETGTPSLATMVQVLDDPVPDIPGVPTNFSNVLRQAMAPYAEDRYSSAAEFRDALAGLDLNSDTAPRPSSAPPVSGGSVYGSSASAGSNPSGRPPTGNPSGGGRPAANDPPAVYGVGTPFWTANSAGGPPAAAPSTSGNPFGTPAYGPPNSGPPNSGPPNSGSQNASYQNQGHPHSGGPGYGPPRQGNAGPSSNSGSTSVFPANTFGPAGPGYGHPGPPLPPASNGNGSGRSSGKKRGLVVVGVVVAVLLVAAGIGTAISAFVNSSPDHDRPPSSSGPGGPYPGRTQQPGTDQPSGSPSDGSSPQNDVSPEPSGQLPNLPGLPTTGGNDTGTKTSGNTCSVVKAAASADARASCPTKPKCWSARSAQGLVTATDCGSPHLWETFVIGTLSASTTPTKASSVRADPNVQQLCNRAVLEKALTGSGQQWSIEWKVEFALTKATLSGGGNRQFHCVAGKGVQLTDSAFVKS